MWSNRVTAYKGMPGMQIWHEIEQCRSALVRQMYAAWSAKRRGTAVPLRRDIDIEDYGDFNRRLSELQEKIENWRPPPITMTEPSGGP